MLRSLLAYMRALRFKKIMFVGAVTALAGVIAIVLLVVFLPTLLSTSQAQSLLRLQLSKSLKKPVSWSNLTLSWSQGLTLSGLTVGDGPPPLLNANLAELRVKPGLEWDDSGRYTVSLDVKLRKLEASLAPGPKQPPPEKPAKDPLTQVAEAVQKFQGMEWPLPVDVRLAVDAAPMTVSYLDPASGRQTVLREVSFALAAPSLARLPIDTSLEGSVALPDAKPQRVHFKARLSDLVTAKDKIKPAAALLSVQAGFPGVTLDAGGGVNRPGGLKAKLRVNLPELAPLATAMAHRELPTLDGKLALDLGAELDRNADLMVLLDLACDRLSVGKIPGKKGTAGPLDLKLHQKLVSDHKRQRVTFSDGALESPGLLSAAWSAVVDRPTERSRSVAADLGPLRLDLAAARRLAAPFLPANLPVQVLTGTASVAKLAARFKGPDNDGELTLEKAGVDLPQLGLRLANGSLQGEGLSLVLERAAVPLKKLAPLSLAADLRLGAKKVELSGKKKVLLQGGEGALALALTELDLKHKRARALIGQSLEFALVQVGPELAVEGLREELQLEGRALSGGELEATLPGLKLSATKLSANQGGKQVVLTPLSATLVAEGVHLPKKGEGSATVKRAHFTATAADALAIEAQAGLSGLIKQVAATTGKARFDLNKLMPVAAPFVPAGLDAKGLAAATWDMEAPLPVATLAKEKNPLRAARGACALLDKGNLALQLDGLDLRIPAAKTTYKVQNLSTTKPLSFSLPAAGKPLAIDGAFSFAGITGLAGAAGQLPLQSGALTLEGELSQWKDLRLTEELQVRSLGLSQVAELTVGGIDRLLDDSAKLDTPTLLKRLDATMFAHLEGNFPREAKQALAGLKLSGNVAAGARLDLTAARELRMRGYTKCRDFGVADGKGMSAQGIRADLVFDRSYALAQGKGGEWIPLSALLVRPAPVAPPLAANSDLAARIYQDLRGEASGPRKIGIKSASFNSGAVPLSATALEADLLLEPDTLGLSFLQAEVGGGTVRARGVIDLSREVPVLSTYCYFSRLDPALLFPASGGARPGEELTGELSLSAPLAAEQRALLEGLKMNLNLRRFSSRILDRALFAIDPYQRNEKVVAQRKSLQLADLKGLRVSAVDGALDCEGELLVKGVGVDIPKLERLRLSELPIRKELERLIAGIASSKALLELARADTLVVGADGALSLKRRSNER
ncbi:hypothetical protein Gbem_0444 [Citrifermentans bemidjiense Bem]|uniref:Uncharacterized protein n=1 Tax=Citrifermentans bemidjiense (strain ATCC BAA-1014 / DSM 16622 / JCM 12645 / Bem) TaxID=404380 RepID=B5EBK4_CITBB|nr:hypothetical protein [Citrifermentans bemidjiense]ACH37473.1 hypothetical protein Gbem_0444 [Citrifermentans bemidjiense Bem]